MRTKFTEVYRNHSVCLFVQLVSFCFDIGISYFAHLVYIITIRRCVAYMHDPNTMLTFDFKVKYIVFSSHELKAQVSFSDRLSSVCPSVSVHPSINFSYFQHLLQNHWANFNQTWHKASLRKGDSSLFK